MERASEWEAAIPDRWSGAPFDEELARPELLHRLFEARVDANPQAIAVEFGGERLSYGELEARSNQLAHRLRGLGAGPGSHVGMLLPRGADVYVALLGILKSGAAYVPIDPSYPADRIAFILADCQVQALVSTEPLSRSLALSAPRVLLDSERSSLQSLPAVRPPSGELAERSRQSAYVIYTSGTTGKPKGVPISHRSACNLVRAEGRIFQVRPDDRVYQGFSIAFDASVEEVWLAFFSGATLVAASDEMVHAGPELPRHLREARISVLSCVPTLLAMMSQEVHSIRLLIVGGEACSEAMVRTWARPERRMVNTYGPTEATVIATFGDLSPERPVTIGTPAPNYRVFVLDEQLQAVPAGTPGELHLGGVGLSSGYLNRPELTREKFVANPFAARWPDAPVLYKTGDLVRFNSRGELEFLGRIDSQVKLRGFRIELGEIDSALLDCPGVLAAVAAVREDVPGVQQLVGYVVARPGEQPQEEAIREQLRTRLAPFMVPALIEQLDVLPTLPSGKVDRKQLPAPKPRQATARPDRDPPQGELEQRLAAVWEKLFAPAKVSRHDDFFLDLGGHSLLAARMVSELRSAHGLARLSMLDVYQHPTVAGLAEHLQSTDRAKASPRPASEPRPRASRGQYLAFCAAQAVGLYFVFGFFSLQWLAPFLTYAWAEEAKIALLPRVAVSLGSLLGLYPLMLAAAVVAKWLLIGRYRAGRYPLWGWFHLRMWFVNQLLGVVPIDYLTGGPLLNLYYRLLGARIGKDVHIATDNIRIFDLVSIGDQASLGADCSLHACVAEAGELRVGPIDIGAGCRVGSSAVVSEDVVMGPGSRLRDLSLLPSGTRVPANEVWHGSPAFRIGAAPPAAVGPRRTLAAKLYFGGWHLLAAMMLDFFVLAAILPGVMVIHAIEEQFGHAYLLASPAVAASFIVILALEVVAVKWLLLGRVKAGSYPVDSGFFVRKWLVDGLMEVSLDILGPMYATMFLPLWYRLLGCKLGKNAEISTAAHTSPDLLFVGDESFIADGVALGPQEVERGVLKLSETRIGKRAFVGNSAVVPAGYRIADESLIGVLSGPPLNEAAATEPGTSWLGSPALFLPQRAVNEEYSAASTYQPPRRLYLVRGAIELVRVVLPATVFVLVTSVLVEWVHGANASLGMGAALALFPIFFLACALAAGLFVVAAKWLLMGRYRAGETPLWSRFVWLNELVTALHEHVANPLLVDLLTGTPFAAWFFRLMGSKIGSRVFLETTQFTEYDLIRIGDEVCINEDCTLQTHLFEDRVMKMSTVEIGKGCTVGSCAVVLYDTKMEPGSSLDHLSLLMKGEVLHEGTRWRGAPARSAADATGEVLESERGAA